MTLLPDVWRPSTLSVLDQCPRRFALRQQGWEPIPDPFYPQAPHAEFGTIWHKAAENYDTVRFEGGTPNQALDYALKVAINDTWTDDGPWAGNSLEQWTCTGMQRSASGRRKFLCDAARDWWAGDQRRCPKCGRETERKLSYVANHASKNRHTLLRAVVTYCDNADAFDVGSFDGVGPALETEIEFDLGPYRIQMHMDRYSTLGDQAFCHERKTTSRQVGAGYWLGYEQSLQIQMYDLGMHSESLAIATDNGLVHIGPRRCDGVILEALQVMAGGEKLSRHIITRGPDQRRETENYVTYLIGMAQEGYEFCGEDTLKWPTRLASCLHAAGGKPCEFLKVCTKPTHDARQYALETQYQRRDR